MSTLAGEYRCARLASENELTGYFHQFIKERSRFGVGLEAEFFAVSKLRGKAVPYDGPEGVEAALKMLAENFGYQTLIENDHVIGLKKGDIAIALEPGGQVELSAPPVSDIFQIEKQVCDFLADLRKVAGRFRDMLWLAVGIQPFSRLDEIAWVPKKRYDLMSEYFKTRGTLSHWMMKMTATNQMNLDYSSEQEAMESLRTALGITSIVTALFANSSFSGGAPNGFMTQRLHIWNHTDPDRTGILAGLTRPELTFHDYLNYLLDMPMIFLVRQTRWIPVTRLTFREFIRSGYQGFEATLGDFELHLSTAFPEVRLKPYLEIRGIDCQSPDLIPSVAAFWKGILFDPEARRRAWERVGFASESERLQLHADVPRLGLKARLGDRPIFPIAADLVELSRQGLRRQREDRHSPDEAVFIDRITDKILACGKSPAEILLEHWSGKFKRNPCRLIEYLSIG